MAHRILLTDRQRSALFDLPTDEASILKHYTLADDDLEHIRARRRTENRIGFALQLCALRYPGRLLSHGEVIPETVLRSIGAQLGIGDDAVLTYAARRQTRQEHLEALRTTYGYRMFTGHRAREMAAWLAAEAEDAHSGEDLVRRFAAECRSRQIILPGITIIERRCAHALVAAERRIEARIARRLDDAMRSRLDALLAEEVTDRLTRFVWLRKFEVGRNSADINRLLDRLEFLKGLGLSPDVLAGIPPHRVARLRRQGERYFSDGIRELSSERRLAILAVCALEWRAAIADTVVETHDRIVGRTWREAERLSALRVAEAHKDLRATLSAFQGLGSALIEAKEDGAALEDAVAASCGWSALEQLVAVTAQLTDTVKSDPLAHVVQGYRRFRRYAPRMLRMLAAL